MGGTGPDRPGGPPAPHPPTRQVWMRLASPKLQPHADDEGTLVRRAQAGDRSGFEVLVERYWDRLYRWLYHLTRSQHAAEDVAQETFLKAFAALGSFRAGSNFRAWLFRIGYNCFVNERRDAARARQAVPPQLADDEDGPPEQAMSREAIEALTRAVGRLPAEYRAPLLLRAEEDLSFRQIAEILGTTEETARWRVFKARQKLMNVLAPQPDRENS